MGILSCMYSCYQNQHSRKRSNDTEIKVPRKVTRPNAYNIFTGDFYKSEGIHNIHNYMCGISVVCVYTYNFVCTPVYIVHVCMCIYVILCICV